MRPVGIIYRAARKLDRYTDIRTLLLWSLNAATADLVQSFRFNNLRRK